MDVADHANDRATFTEDVLPLSLSLSLSGLSRNALGAPNNYAYRDLLSTNIVLVWVAPLA